MQSSDKIQVNISYHIHPPQFSALTHGIMLYSMKPPVFQEIKAVSNAPQFNNRSIPIHISVCVQTSNI